MLAHLLLVALCVGALWMAAGRIQGGPGAGGSSRGLALYQEWLNGLHKLKIRSAVESYYWEKGKLPDSLDQLVSEGFLEMGEHEFPWGRGYFYETYESGTELGYYVYEPVR